MPVNDFTFNQLATVLTDISEQATGKKVLTPTNTSEFVTVAQETLQTAGYDPVLNAISQVLSKTIFSNRPYSAKFGGLQVSNIQYGNHVRKLSPIDKSFENEARLSLTDGVAIDQYVVNKPGVLQTNFYGANVFEKSVTIFRDQLDSAMSGPDEFGSFLGMVMQNVADQIEQAKESVARATLANFIAGKYVGDSTNCIHLLTEYNTLTGLSLTATTVYQPSNFKPFMQWVYSRIASLSSMMTERSIKFHMNVSGKEVTRHTPMEMQKVYLFAPARFQTEAQVLADTFHDNFIKYADNETVNFWQSIDTPSEIDIKPVYLNASTGGLTIAAESQNIKNLFGVIFDKEAVGYTIVNETTDMSPYNARGRYQNVFYHFTLRYWNDFTENGVVLLLD